MAHGTDVEDSHEPRREQPSGAEPPSPAAAPRPTRGAKSPPAPEDLHIPTDPPRV